MNTSNLVPWIKDVTRFLKSQRAVLNFGKDTRFSCKDFEIMLGVTKENFQIIFECCNKDIRNSKNR